MKLSVVIPVFRVENTLRRCVESVLTQSYTDLQVILVDDGSPDSCPILCDRLAASDARIQVVHQENRGLSDARNSGIQMSDGEYITFIDSDDYLSPDTYKPLMETLLRNPVIDMIEYPVVEHEGKGTETKLLTFTRGFHRHAPLLAGGESLHTHIRLEQDLPPKTLFNRPLSTRPGV